MGAIHAAHLNEPGRSPRVFLMTDARPNVGDTSPYGFKTMMAAGAARGIGLGAFGVGIDFGQKLAYEIMQTQGANYFFLCEKPPGSLLDLFGPWPYYLLGGAAVGALFFWLLDLFLLWATSQLMRGG